MAVKYHAALVEVRHNAPDLEKLKPISGWRGCNLEPLSLCCGILTNIRDVSKLFQSETMQRDAIVRKTEVSLFSYTDAGFACENQEKVLL